MSTATDISGISQSAEARRFSAIVENIQGGESTFSEFPQLRGVPGVVRYDVDFEARTVACYGCIGEEYVEACPIVESDSESVRRIGPMAAREQIRSK